MKEKAQVIMLPTDKACEGCVIRYDRLTPHYMVRNITYQTQEWLKQENNRSSHHLYIVTDDEIKEGDWCLFFWDGNKEGELGQIGSKPQQYFPENGHTLNKNLRKIIATTDPNLQANVGGYMLTQKLPQIPQSFIEEYCRKGGIDEVDVEYGKYRDGNFINDGKTHAFTTLLRPKVNSDNTINIHLVKDTYTREEVEQLCVSAYADGFYEGTKKDSPCKDPVFWLRENL